MGEDTGYKGQDHYHKWLEDVKARGGPPYCTDAEVWRVMTDTSVGAEKRLRSLKEVINPMGVSHTWQIISDAARSFHASASAVGDAKVPELGKVPDGVECDSSYTKSMTWLTSKTKMLPIYGGLGRAVVRHDDGVDIAPSIGSVIRVDDLSGVVTVQLKEPPTTTIKYDTHPVVAEQTMCILSDSKTCGHCDSNDTHEVCFGVPGVETYFCNNCSRVNSTFADEPSGGVSGDLPESAVERTHTHYNILENGFTVGVATDKGYHHHILIPHLGFETVKENVKNWAIETGYTLEVKD